MQRRESSSSSSRRHRRLLLYVGLRVHSVSVCHHGACKRKMLIFTPISMCATPISSSAESALCELCRGVKITSLKCVLKNARPRARILSFLCCALAHSVFGFSK